MSLFSFQRSVSYPQRFARGFTLVELVGVLVILSLVAGMIVPLVGRSSGTLSVNAGSGDQSAEQIVTMTTMRAMRDAIAGTSSGRGVWADLGGVANRLPRTIDRLFRSQPPQSPDFGALAPPFNPVTRIGWRGPYLTGQTGTYPDIDAPHPMTGNVWSDDGFVGDYGDVGDAAMIDAWGNPIVLQVNMDEDDASVSIDEARIARLVSAGPNGRIDLAADDTRSQSQFMEDNALLPVEQRIDDVVLYLGLTN